MSLLCRAHADRPHINTEQDYFLTRRPFAACAARASSSISASEICPPNAYHATLTMPSTAASTHPAIAPMLRGRQPRRCGNGPSWSPVKSVVDGCPAALPVAGRPCAAHWAATYGGGWISCCAAAGASRNVTASPASRCHLHARGVSIRVGVGERGAYSMWPARRQRVCKRGGEGRLTVEEPCPGVVGAKAQEGGAERGDLHGVAPHGVRLTLRRGRVDAWVVGRDVRGLVHDLELVAVQVAAGAVRRPDRACGTRALTRGASPHPNCARGSPRPGLASAHTRCHTEERGTRLVKLQDERLWAVHRDVRAVVSHRELCEEAGRERRVIGHVVEHCAAPHGGQRCLSCVWCGALTGSRRYPLLRKRHSSRLPYRGAGAAAPRRWEPVPCRSRQSTPVGHSGQNSARGGWEMGAASGDGEGKWNARNGGNRDREWGGVAHLRIDCVREGRARVVRDGGGHICDEPIRDFVEHVRAARH